jgi:hypothetical protein
MQVFLATLHDHGRAMSVQYFVSAATFETAADQVKHHIAKVTDERAPWVTWSIVLIPTATATPGIHAWDTIPMLTSELEMLSDGSGPVMDDHTRQPKQVTHYNIGANSFARMH